MAFLRLATVISVVIVVCCVHTWSSPVFSALNPNGIVRRFPLHYSSEFGVDPVEDANNVEWIFMGPRHPRTIRRKRSPYPPGFVTWAWKQPCFCPPGNVTCRCYSTTQDSRANSKKRRRVSRSKKLRS